MTITVEALRDLGDRAAFEPSAFHKAADEITRLRAENAQQAREIARLREGLGECVVELENGLETPGELEAEHSIHARLLIASIRKALKGE